MNLAISGSNSNIAKEFIKLPYRDNCGHISQFNRIKELPLDYDMYLICNGVLHGKSANDATLEQLQEKDLVCFFNDQYRVIDPTYKHYFKMFG